MTEQRQEFLKELAGRINDLQLGHPIRVAIDGVDTSGKTTLANELVEPLKSIGRPVVRASIDGFHKPRDERYVRGKDSPEGYYLDSFDNQSIIEKLLQPFGSGELYQVANFDYRTDKPVETKPEKSETNAILLFDGVFLLRPELNPHWDIRIFLQVPFEETLRRAIIRDRETMGDELEHKYQTRYIPGQKLYLDSEHPEKLADIVVDNTDVNIPKIL